MLIEERVVTILQTSTELCVNRFSHVIFFNKLLFDPCIHINDISFHMTIQKKNYKNLADVVRLAAELGVRKVTSQYVSIVPLEINKNTERELGEAFHNEMFHWNILNITFPS